MQLTLILILKLFTFIDQKIFYEYCISIVFLIENFQFINSSLWIALSYVHLHLINTLPNTFSQDFFYTRKSSSTILLNHLSKSIALSGQQYSSMKVNDFALSPQSIVPIDVVLSTHTGYKYYWKSSSVTWQ